MTDPDDSILIERTRSGELAAFEQLVRRYQDLVAGTAYGWLGDPELARDVAQEVFLEAHLKLDQLAEPAAFRGWLRRIVIKQCDRVSRRPAPDQAELREGLLPAADGASPAGQVERSQVADQIRFAVAGLPRQERVVVALQYFAEATGPELADYLEVPLSTVKKRLRSARTRLKNHGDRLMQETIDRMKPSASVDLSRDVLFFLALRAGDRAEVARLLALDPQLADARQQWAPEVVHNGLLPFATDATALITAIELDDLDMLELLLDAGADVNGLCGCLTAESPLWAATLFNRLAHVKRLLEAGADPNLASMTGNYPLHLAAMRGHDALVALLLAHGADPSLGDAGPKYPRPFAPRDGQSLEAPVRTAADWARENGHDGIVALLDQATGERAQAAPERGIVRVNEQILHTGIKAIDLFAPLCRGQAIRVPFKAGVGMVVLLGELCSRFCQADAGAAVWTGFAQPPFDLKDWQAEMAEFGLVGIVQQHLASFNESPEVRRQAFEDGVDEALRLAGEGRDVFVVVQSTDGFEGEVDAALLRFAGCAGPGSVTAMVITSFPETAGAIWSELSAPYAGQIVLDRRRAKAHLFPAIDPLSSLSAAHQEDGGERSADLARQAARLIEEYQQRDPEFAALSSASSEPAARLLHYLCQPFQVTEPFTGRPGEWVGREQLLDAVAAIIGTQAEGVQ